MKCMKCNSENLPSSKFCIKCGQKLLIEEKMCPQCNIKKQSTAKFCTSCGFDFTLKELICSECKNSNSLNSKFCTKCGKKFDIQNKNNSISPEINEASPTQNVGVSEGQTKHFDGASPKVLHPQPNKIIIDKLKETLIKKGVPFGEILSSYLNKILSPNEFIEEVVAFRSIMIGTNLRIIFLKDYTNFCVNYRMLQVKKEDLTYLDKSDLNYESIYFTEIKSVLIKKGKLFTSLIVSTNNSEIEIPNQIEQNVLSFIKYFNKKVEERNQLQQTIKKIILSSLSDFISLYKTKDNIWWPDLKNFPTEEELETFSKNILSKYNLNDSPCIYSVIKEIAVEEINTTNQKYFLQSFLRQNTDISPDSNIKQWSYAYANTFDNLNYVRLVQQITNFDFDELIYTIKYFMLEEDLNKFVDLYLDPNRVWPNIHNKPSLEDIEAFCLVAKKNKYFQLSLNEVEMLVDNAYNNKLIDYFLKSFYKFNPSISSNNSDIYWARCYANTFGENFDYVFVVIMILYRPEYIENEKNKPSLTKNSIFNNEFVKDYAEYKAESTSEIRKKLNNITFLKKGSLIQQLLYYSTESTIMNKSQFANSEEYEDFKCKKFFKEKFESFINLVKGELAEINKSKRAEKIALAMQAGISLSSKHNIEDIDKMDPIQFEHFLGDLFKAMGYKVTVTKASSDQGADVIIEKYGEKTVVQAKRYSYSVSNSSVQEAVAAKAHYNCYHAIVVTNNYFTESAKELAKSNNVKLIDRDKLINLIDQYL